MEPKRTPLRSFAIQLLVGLLLLGTVFLIVTRSDFVNAQRSMIETVRYVKEQFGRYNRIDLASETKSLMRIIEGAQSTASRLAEGTGTEKLSDYAQVGSLSGILLLDENGQILQEYHRDGQAPEVLADVLGSSALLQTAHCPEKRYATRQRCPDGSHLDAAATARLDAPGIVVVYYHTPLEYIQTFSLSVASLLEGYTLADNGTIVVSDGASVVSSNDTSLIGTDTDQLEILRQIKRSAVSDQLVHARQTSGSLAQYFGLMEHGRGFYVYAFQSEQRVFRSTWQALFYALVVYLVILAALNMARWHTAQSFRERQLQAQQRHAEELKSKNSQLQAAVDQANRANAAKTGFLSRMSHDIRTPLNGIIGLLEIDATHPDDLALLQSNQQKMKVAANHLLSLINDVLQMSKLESGEVTLAHEPMDLNQLAADILTIVDQRAADAGVTLEYDHSADRVAVGQVYGSPLHLRQVFLNIYGNCIKYNKVGGRVSTRVDCLDRTDTTVTYRWTIRDTGRGMSQEFLAHIFDPFSQELSDARSVYHGTGLGMAIVKSLIDAMHGEITITSQVGVGTQFVITLPFDLASERPAPTPEPETPARTDVRGLHLLVAEDNELNAEIAQALLTARGITVTLAPDGAEALRLFEEHPPGTFDAILMDVMMPNLDGLAATRAIRALHRPDARTIPILAMTANAFEEDAQRCLEAGMNAHLTKPLQIETLVAAIARLCRPNG